MDRHVVPPWEHLGAGEAAGLEEFAMHVRDLARAASLMEVVDVLGAQEQGAAGAAQSLLEPSERAVRVVCGRGEEVPTPRVVEGVDGLRVSGERLGGRELHGIE